MLDAAVRATGSITLSALDIGHHVDMIPVNTNEITHFPPFAEDLPALVNSPVAQALERKCPTALQSIKTV